MARYNKGSQFVRRTIRVPEHIDDMVCEMVQKGLCQNLSHGYIEAVRKFVQDNKKSLREMDRMMGG